VIGWIAGGVGALAAGAAAARALGPPRRRPAGDLRLHRLADGVFLYRGYFSNSAVLVGDGGVVVVDTQVSPLAAQRLRDAIARVTALPVRYVVNTHYHGDHSGGNALFPEAQVVATDETARFVVERDGERLEYARTFGLEFETLHPTAPPTRTFSGRLDLDLGRDRFELLQLGRVETPDACIVHWPARRVVACGDGVATIDYPFLGVPFLDEGLRDDGSWIGFLDAIAALRPSLLLPGHGPPLVGERAIAARLQLLRALFTDLLGAVKEELARGTPLEPLVERVQARLSRYPSLPSLREYTVSQRFAIYRCVNNLLPERRGRGWWGDLRPSVIRRAPPPPVDDARALVAAAGLARAGRRPEAIALLEAHLARDPAAAAWGLLADVLFDGARAVRPTVDATEYLAAAGEAARRALALDPGEPLALLNLGALDVFGAMVLAQPMARGLARLERALAAPALTREQRSKAAFFVGKAHQMELRDGEADRWYRLALPRWARPFYPLLRQKMRAYP
jgi:glyoxylase-like metal-dependent hydrolase (beta-lactamase superfamily II)